MFTYQHHTPSNFLNIQFLYYILKLEVNNNCYIHNIKESLYTIGVYVKKLWKGFKIIDAIVMYFSDYVIYIYIYIKRWMKRERECYK